MPQAIKVYTAKKTIKVYTARQKNSQAKMAAESFLSHGQAWQKLDRNLLEGGFTSLRR